MNSHRFAHFCFCGLAGVALMFSVGVSAAAVRPSSAEDAGRNPIAPIIDGMNEAKRRLAKGETGPQTRQVQQNVLSELQKLIDSAGRSKSSQNQRQAAPSSPRSSSSGGRAAETPQGARQGQQQRDRKQAGAARRPGNNSGGKPKGPPPELKRSLPSHQRLLREVWGHLPPAMRERMQDADFGETILPAYDDLVRRYFEALLDDSPPPARHAEAPTVGK